MTDFILYSNINSEDAQRARVEQENELSHHAPDELRIRQIGRLRHLFKELAGELADMIPNSRHRTMAYSKLQEASMQTIKAIVFSQPTAVDATEKKIMSDDGVPWAEVEVMQANKSPHLSKPPRNTPDSERDRNERSEAVDWDSIPNGMNEPSPPQPDGFQAFMGAAIFLLLGSIVTIGLMVILSR